MIIKNLIIACVAAVAWWLCGYGLAYANVHNFIGQDGWFFASEGFEKMAEDNYIMWVYEFAYVVVCCVFFTGPLGERTTMVAYIFYSIILSAYVYPVVVAWVWGGGWLARNGFHDFAGAGVVHIVAGASGFWGCLIIGERYGKNK